MKRLIFSVVLALFASPVAAKSMVCVSKGYCTNDLECSSTQERLLVRDLPGGRVQFGWEDSDARFNGTPLRRDGFTFYVADASDLAIQTLVIADDMTATMSVMTVIFDELYHSIQSLTCQETAR